MKKIFLWIGLFLIFIFGVFLFIMLKSTKTNNIKKNRVIYGKLFRKRKTS